MSVQSRDMQLAASYLDDVRNSFDRACPTHTQGAVEKAEAYCSCSYEFDNLMKGDFAKALKHISEAEAQGVDVKEVNSEALFLKGSMAMRTVQLYGSNVNQNKNTKRLVNTAISAFSEIIAMGSEDIDADNARYNMALAYEWLNRKNEAIEALRVVENSSDADLSIKATKMIARLEEKKGGLLGLLRRR
jgi:hypothetical protein